MNCVSGDPNEDCNIQTHWYAVWNVSICGKNKMFTQVSELRGCTFEEIWC